jgi:prepilin-type N-terminal cleavage/methylation domain-containing protein
MMARLRRQPGEGGFTLVELLVASAMGVIVMGAVASLMISAVRDQPKISGEAQNISTARWVLARLTRELRNGVAVKEGTASRISFEGYVRHATCGGSAKLAATSPSIKCRITYECTSTSCSRKETTPPSTIGPAKLVFDGINSNQVFSYSPNAAEATYVKATLHIPDPSGTGSLVVSSGASLRNATLGY